MEGENVKARKSKRGEFKVFTSMRDFGHFSGFRIQIRINLSYWIRIQEGEIRENDPQK
jgi:hypothetical protein